MLNFLWKHFTFHSFSVLNLTEISENKLISFLIASYNNEWQSNASVSKILFFFVFEVSYVNSTFTNLNVDAFVGQVSNNNPESKMTFENIDLKNPGFGSLVSSFPNVIYKNIKVHKKCR